MIVNRSDDGFRPIASELVSVWIVRLTPTYRPSDHLLAEVAKPEPRVLRLRNPHLIQKTPYIVILTKPSGWVPPLLNSPPKFARHIWLAPSHQLAHPRYLVQMVYRTNLMFPLANSVLYIICLTYKPVKAFLRPLLKVSLIGHSILFFLCCIGWKIFLSKAGRMISSALCTPGISFQANLRWLTPWTDSWSGAEMSIWHNALMSTARSAL